MDPWGRQNRKEKKKTGILLLDSFVQQIFIELLSKLDLRLSQTDNPALAYVLE